MSVPEDSIGLIEVKGLVALLAGIEAMCKSSVVECVFVRRVSSGFLVAAIQGSAGAVQHALDVGADVAARYGTLRSRQLYISPHEQITTMLLKRQTWLAQSTPAQTNSERLAP